MSSGEKVRIFFQLEQDEDGYPPCSVESLWAEPLNGQFRMSNTPFYVRGLSYGDLVSAKTTEGRLEFERVVEKSGHGTIRVILFDDEQITRLLDFIEANHLGYESMNKTFFTIDIQNVVARERVLKFLDSCADQDFLDYEEGDVAFAVGSPQGGCNGDI